MCMLMSRRLVGTSPDESAACADRAPRRRSTRTNNIGMRNTAISVAVSMPVITTVPRMRRAAAPDPLADPERHAAEDEGERRHQDRPQPQLCTFERGGHNVEAMLDAQLGELDNQDRVLRREADQHDDADLRVDVVVEARRDSPANAPNTATGTDSRTENGSDQLS